MFYVLFLYDSSSVRGWGVFHWLVWEESIAISSEGGMLITRQQLIFSFKKQNKHHGRVFDAPM